MTQFTINQTIAAIRKTTKKATKSKKAALKFLIDAGIIKS